MKGEDQGRKQDEEGPVRLHGDESVDPNTEASLSLSLSLSLLSSQPFVYLRRAPRTCLPAAKVCQPRVRARTMPRGQAEMGGVGVYSAHFEDYPRISRPPKEERRDSRSSPHSSAFFSFPFLSLSSFSNFGIDLEKIILSCIVRCILFLFIFRDKLE